MHITNYEEHVLKYNGLLTAQEKLEYATEFAAENFGDATLVALSEQLLQDKFQFLLAYDKLTQAVKVFNLVSFPSRVTNCVRVLLAENDMTQLLIVEMQVGQKKYITASQSLEDMSEADIESFIDEADTFALALCLPLYVASEVKELLEEKA